VVLAEGITSSRCEGGKAPRSAGPRSVSEPREAPGQMAPAPSGDGVPIAAGFGGDLEVGGLVFGGGPEDQPAAER
jgi:hypothetical protein